MLVCIPELILVRETQTHLGSAERKEFVSSQNPEAGSERDTSQFLKCWEDSLSICSALLCISSTFLHYRLTSSLTKSFMASIFKASKGKGREVWTITGQILKGSPWTRCFPQTVPLETGSCGSIHKVRWGFSSIAQSCPTLCYPMNRSTPGLPVHHQLPESTQTHVHRVGDAIQPSHPLLSPSPPALNLSQHQGLFQWVSSSHQVAKVLKFQLQHQVGGGLVFPRRMVVNERGSFTEVTTVMPFKNMSLDFPGDPVVKNLAADAEDMGLIPGWEDSTCPGVTKPVHDNYWACPLELRSLNYRAHVLQLQKPMHLESVLYKLRSNRNEKPTHCSQRRTLARCN